MPSHLGPLWPGVEAPDWVLSMGQIEENVRKQMSDDKLWQFNVFTNHIYI